MDPASIPFGSRQAKDKCHRRSVKHFLSIFAVFFCLVLSISIKTDGAAAEGEKGEKKELGKIWELEGTKEIEELKVSVTLKKGKDARIAWEAQPGAVSYQVQRKDNKGGKFVKIAAVDSSVHKYIDTKVQGGREYGYRIVACMEYGDDIYSGKTVFACPFARVEGVKLDRDTATSIQVAWNQNQDVPYYKVYCSKKKGSFQYAGTTTENAFLVKNLELNQKYYVYVKACASKKDSSLDSKMSKAAAIKTKVLQRMTVFAGDSITTGLTAYQILDKMNITGDKKTVADIGLNTTTFRTRRVFDGKSGLERVIAYKPYRVYLMLGINEIAYRSSADVAAGYREIINAVRAGAPDTDIVLLAVSPVTRAEQQRTEGYAQIPDLNKRLKAMAKEFGIRYYDYTGFLKDASGCLNSSLAAGDGVHWTISAYQAFSEAISKYDKSLG